MFIQFPLFNYSVPSPHSLWHIDSNLKLIRWGFPIQGAVDRYSRVVIYARCSPNNTAATTLECFMEAVKVHGRPSRVRCDYGGENRLVGLNMLESRGLNRGSIIAGPSTHNTRIEQMWKECGRSFIQLYSRIFNWLESRDSSLDISNSFHLYCFQYVYLPTINRSIDEWKMAWNSHPMVGRGNLSPLQLREKGFLGAEHLTEAVSGKSLMLNPLAIWKNLKLIQDPHDLKNI